MNPPEMAFAPCGSLERSQQVRRAVAAAVLDHDHLDPVTAVLLPRLEALAQHVHVVERGHDDRKLRSHVSAGTRVSLKVQAQRRIKPSRDDSGQSEHSQSKNSGEELRTG